MTTNISKKDETLLQNARRQIERVKLHQTMLIDPVGWTERQHILFNMLATAELLLCNVVAYHDIDGDIAAGMRAHLETGLRTLPPATARVQGEVLP
jgi:hypothetical protein